jgi:hypothetical protein
MRMKPVSLLFVLALGGVCHPALAQDGAPAAQAAAAVQSKLTLPDGTVYTGTLRDGVPDGHGYFLYPNGNQYEGDVRMGRRNGSGEMAYAKGDDYKGEWKNGKRDGTGVLVYMLGGRYEGPWKNDKPCGEGKLVFAGTPGREAAVVDGRLPERAAAPTLPPTRYTLKQDRPSTGSNITRDVAREIPVPPTLGYDKLSAAEQDSVRRWFPALAPGDEPPYPLTGPAPFYKTVQRIVSATRQQGEIRVYVLVGKDGKLVNVTAIGLDNPEVRKAVSMAAGMLQYKPAQCAGQPCEMMYPYSLALTMEP